MYLFDWKIALNLEDFLSSAEQLCNDERAFKPSKVGVLFFFFFFLFLWFCGHKMKCFIHIHTPMGTVSVIKDATNETLMLGLD